MAHCYSCTHLYVGAFEVWRCGLRGCPAVDVAENCTSHISDEEGLMRIVERRWAEAEHNPSYSNWRSIADLCGKTSLSLFLRNGHNMASERMNARAAEAIRNAIIQLGRQHEALN